MQKYNIQRLNKALLLQSNNFTTLYYAMNCVSYLLFDFEMNIFTYDKGNE